MYKFSHKISEKNPIFNIFVTNQHHNQEITSNLRITLLSHACFLLSSILAKSFSKSCLQVMVSQMVL